MTEIDLSNYPKDGRRFTEEERKALIKKARPIFLERTAVYAARMNASPGRITVRTQKTRWGSCTLCHLKYMNHSKYFYFELKRFYPAYQEPREWLKKNGGRLVKMLPKEVLKRKRRRFWLFG